jgi:hypothetical protein
MRLPFAELHIPQHFFNNSFTQLHLQMKFVAAVAGGL